MGLLTKKRLADIPVIIGARPEWRDHEARVAQLAERVELHAASVGTFEQQRRDVAAELSEHQVAVALGEDAEAAAHVATDKKRLAQIDKQLEAAREQLAVQQAALGRVQARGSALQAELGRQIEAEVRDAYRSLNQALADKLRELQPIAHDLATLRHVHGTSPALRSAVWIDPDLVPRIADSGLENKLHAWQEAARNMGVDI